MPGVIDECRGLRSTHEVIYNARETLNRAATQGGGTSHRARGCTDYRAEVLERL